MSGNWARAIRRIFIPAPRWRGSAPRFRWSPPARRRSGGRAQGAVLNLVHPESPETTGSIDTSGSSLGPGRQSRRGGGSRDTVPGGAGRSRIRRPKSRYADGAQGPAAGPVGADGAGERIRDNYDAVGRAWPRLPRARPACRLGPGHAVTKGFPWTRTLAAVAPDRICWAKPVQEGGRQAWRTLQT